MSARNRVGSVAVVIAAVVAATASCASEGGDVAAPGIRIRAGTLLDGRGGIQHDVVVRVLDGVIAEISPSGGGPVDYDLSAYTLMPGGIDTHVHIDWHFDPDGRFHHLSREEEGPEQRRAYAEENALATLRSGITTIQTLGTASDGPLRDDIAAGLVPGPRILTSIRQISRGDPDQLREAVRGAAEQGADVIKLFASASIRVGGTPTLSLEQLEAACGEATALGLRSAVHAHGPESAIRVAQAGCTVVEHGALLDDASLDTLAARGMYFDPNIGLVLQNYLENRDRYEGIGSYDAEGFAHMEAAVPLALDAFKRALERAAPRGAAPGTPGIRIVFGTDAVAGAHGRNFEELIYRVEQGGQDAMDAIISGTSLAAESLRLGDTIGTLAPGYQADIIATDGDPSTDIAALRDVVFVMKGGTVHRQPGDG